MAGVQRAMGQLGAGSRPATPQAVRRGRRHERVVPCPTTAAPACLQAAASGPARTAAWRAGVSRRPEHRVGSAAADAAILAPLEKPSAMTGAEQAIGLRAASAMKAASSLVRAFRSSRSNTPFGEPAEKARHAVLQHLAARREQGGPRRRRPVRAAANRSRRRRCRAAATAADDPAGSPARSGE